MPEWKVPGYTELRTLGSGGFGDVVAARHDQTGVLVAIKYLRPELLADPVFAEMFRAEARILSGLDNPNIVRLHHYAESDSGAAIVMELIDGVSLREILARYGATTPEAALVVLHGSLMGLAATHRLGVVHRDYKPENVLVDGVGASKLSDFGLAARSGQRPLPAGTLAYAAPEQFEGALASPTADVYAATATFYECVTGRPPFAGDPAELARHHREDPVPLGSVPETLRPLVAAGLAKNPADRPADAMMLATQLEDAAAAAYGPDWHERGRSRIGEVALLLAALWPSAVPLVQQGTAMHGVSPGNTPPPAPPPAAPPAAPPAVPSPGPAPGQVPGSAPGPGTAPDPGLRPSLGSGPAPGVPVSGPSSLPVPSWLRNLGVLRTVLAMVVTMIIVAAIVLITVGRSGGSGAASLPGGRPATPGALPIPGTLYVVNYDDGTVTPFSPSSGTAGTPIRVGKKPGTIAITPDGKTAYVVNYGDGTVTPVNLATGTPGSPISVGRLPQAIAITPDGQTAYVTNAADNTVTPITLATDTPGAPISVGWAPEGIAITPDGQTAYVANFSDGTVTPITLATGTPGTAISVGPNPTDIAITPDGQTVYVTNLNAGTVTPIDVASGTPGTPINFGVGYYPEGIAITPDGQTAYVTIQRYSGHGTAMLPYGTVDPIDIATGAIGTPIKVDGAPESIVIIPDGRTAYVADPWTGIVTPIDLVNGSVRPAISVGKHPGGIAITP